MRYGSSCRAAQRQAEIEKEFEVSATISSTQALSDAKYLELHAKPLQTSLDLQQST